MKIELDKNELQLISTVLREKAIKTPENNWKTKDKLFKLAKATEVATKGTLE